jgi:AsmA protein
MIQILSLNLRESAGALDANNILLTVAGLGTATGNGTVSAAKALNFHVVAKLQGGVANVATSAISMIGGAAGGLAGNALKNGIPVTITGTASSPIITPDMKGLTAGAANPASLLGKNGPQIPNTKNLGKSLGGLLGRH